MYIIKKILSQFISPVSLSLEITVAGLFLLYLTSKQKSGKALVLVGMFVLAFCSYSPTADMLIDPLIKRYPPYKHDNQLLLNSRPEIVVVLGAGYRSESSIPITSRIGYDSLVRLIEGIRIYKMMSEGTLILSGGSEPGTISSAQDMSELAQDLGVNEKDIIVEANSRDTEDEANILRSIIGENSFVLVTSSVHMPRSMELFRQNGMNPVPAPTLSIEERLLSRTPGPFFPSSINLQKSEMAFHEYLGIIWKRLRTQI